jgi:hypothetical protein
LRDCERACKKLRVRAVLTPLPPFQRVGTVLLSVAWVYTAKADEAPGRAEAATKPVAHGEDGVLFKYFYGDMGKYVAHRYPSFTCPLCALKRCQSLEALLCHLECAHHHFLFRFVDTVPGQPELHVGIRKKLQAALSDVCQSPALEAGVELDAPGSPFAFVRGPALRQRLRRLYRTRKQWIPALVKRGERGDLHDTPVHTPATPTHVVFTPSRNVQTRSPKA